VVVNAVTRRPQALEALLRSRRRDALGHEQHQRVCIGQVPQSHLVGCHSVERPVGALVDAVLEGALRSLLHRVPLPLSVLRHLAPPPRSRAASLRLLSGRRYRIVDPQLRLTGALKLEGEGSCSTPRRHLGKLAAKHGLR